MTTEFYTTTLSAGQGIVEETLILLDLWDKGMDAASLYQLALRSGRFQKLAARRVRNLVLEGFAPRLLADGGRPAIYLKALKETLARKELVQLLFLFTCRAHRILYDFVQEVYWTAYSSGRELLSNEESREFVIRANQGGRTTSPWSENMIERVAGYLTGTLADLDLLEDGRKRVRRILPYRIESRVAFILAYELHFAGHGDNKVLDHSDWALFGLDRNDVLDELKRQALRGWLIVQSAGGVTRIGWPCQTMEELVDALIKG